jgi:polysaccharide pyruvyl transferase WcaK-like protein
MPSKETALPQNWVSGKMIGVNLSNLILSGKYDADIIKIKTSYYYLIEKIIERTDRNIVFIPHVMQGNDLEILSELYDKYKSTQRVVLIDNEELYAPELKYIISQCRFLVTARTHASIAAYSSFVPTLVLGYSVKSIGIARDLFGTEEGYVISIQNLNDEKELWNNFEKIMNKENEIRCHLKKIIPGYQNKLKELVPFVVSVLNK